MENKIKFGLNARLIVGIVFGALGAIYLPIGLISLAVGAMDGTQVVGIVFTALGAVFLTVGIILLVFEFSKREQIRQAVENRRYIWGEIVEIERNHAIRVNGRCPYVVLARYRGRNGQLHIFRSRNLLRYPDSSIIGQQVRIYCKDETFKIYYMDLDGVLPSVIEH